MYFLFALVALLCWSGSDLFSKLGTSQKDKYSHFRVIFFVGIIMGLHAVITLIVSPYLPTLNGTPEWWRNIIYTDFKFIDFIRYLPVASIYLSAMVIGYAGLRYIELSVSSPICNSSGSLAFIICLLIGCANLDELSSNELIFTIIGVILIAFGILFLSITEYREDDEMRKLRQDKSYFKYSKSLLAILIPIIYLVLDAFGTVGDQIVSEYEIFPIGEYAANTAFEFTSLLFAIGAFIFLKVKKQKVFSTEVKGTKYLVFGGTCETFGQIFYMAVMFSDFKAGMPMISAYCVVSVLWSRIFLKEKLSLKHYLCILLTFIGIILLGIFSPV